MSSPTPEVHEWVTARSPERGAHTWMGRATMQRRTFIAAMAVATLGLAGCGAGSGSSSSDSSGGRSGGSTIKVAYQQFGEGKVMANFLASVKDQFAQQNPGKTVELVPIVASENDYYTKLSLMMRSERTTPDLVYEDTFLINSDIKAGSLRPLDDRIGSWPDWSQFVETAKGAAKGQDGKTYGIPDGTDT